MDKKNEDILKYLKELIEETALPDDSKSKLEKFYRDIRKVFLRDQFKLERTLKDKTIGIRLLNQTIDDLQKHQSLLEESNQILIEQKKEIEKQKEIVEEQTKELADRLNELQMSYSELERFAYLASHDLRTPLRTIRSYGQLLESRFMQELSEEAQSFIGFLNKGANQMNEIVDGLLEYSRVGRMQDEFKLTNLNFTFEHVLYDLRGLIEEKGIKIEAISLPEVIVSRGAMFKLFYHLVKNVLVYSASEELDVSLSCSENEDYYEFLLSEKNKGLEEIFPSYLLENFRADSPGGFPNKGISIAICKKAILLHHGRIYLGKDGNNKYGVFFTIQKRTSPL